MDSKGLKSLKNVVLHVIKLSMSPSQHVTSRKQVKMKQKMQIITIT